MTKRRVEKTKTGRKQYPGVHGKVVDWVVQPFRTHQCPSNFRCHSHFGIFTGNVTGLDVTNCQLYSQAAQVALPTHPPTTL